MAGLVGLAAARQVKAAVQRVMASTDAPKNYDPRQHKWSMAIDVDKCIGCGLCVEACKQENRVPEGPNYFRTWIERYVITKPKPDAAAPRGKVLVSSPNGGMRRPEEGRAKNAAEALPPKEEILLSFFVPKLCNLCRRSPCVQACPVGATFDTPDGAVLVDSKYCIGCGFCIQSCPYGCRFLNPVTHTADKCTLCYHRITRGLQPVCVEVCPTQARLFGDLKSPKPDEPLTRFFRTHRLHTLKPHLGTEPRLVYAGLDKEVS
jgi:Fe-S-cluster-containing dehydrogenase component